MGWANHTSTQGSSALPERCVASSASRRTCCRSCSTVAAQRCSSGVAAAAFMSSAGAEPRTGDALGRSMAPVLVSRLLRCTRHEVAGLCEEVLTEHHLGPGGRCVRGAVQQQLRSPPQGLHVSHTPDLLLCVSITRLMQHSVIKTIDARTPLLVCVWHR